MTLACVSLIEPSLEKMIAAAHNAQNAGADAVEVRLDCMSECPVDETALAALKKNISIPTIITFRTKKDGGLYDAKEAQRLDVLEKAMAYSFSYVDVDFSVETKRRTSLLRSALDNGVTPIVSYHNFEMTPSENEIVKKVVACHDSFPKRAKANGIAKVAFMTRSYDDVLAILKASLAAKKKKIRFAAMGMGTYAFLSRILAPSFGNEIAYASLDERHAAAPGQVDVSTLRALWDSLEYARPKAAKSG